MSTTLRDLYRRLALLLTLTTAFAGCLFGAYRQVHDDALALRTSSARAVLEVETAQHALAQSWETTEPGAGAATQGGVGDADFRAHISVANQSLALAASHNVAGLEGRQALQTATSLIGVYTGFVRKAQQEPVGSVLHEAYRGYATSVLDGSAGVQNRLDALQNRQRAVVAEQASFGAPMWLSWCLALVLFALLLPALLETQRFLRRRFKRRYNRPLLTATGILTLASGVLGSLTWWTYDGLGRSRGLLEGAVAGAGVQQAGAGVARHLEEVDFRAALADWIPIGWVLLMGLIILGLSPWINDYRFRSR